MTAFALIALAVYGTATGYGLFILIDGVARRVRSCFDHKRRFPTARIARRR